MVRDTAVVYPPGSFIGELMDERHMSLKEFAKSVDLPINTARDLLDGKTVVTERVAKRLEGLFGVSAKVFINREILWRKHLLQQRKNGKG